MTAPAASKDVLGKVDYVYKFLRNKTTADATSGVVFNDGWKGDLVPGLGVPCSFEYRSTPEAGKPPKNPPRSGLIERFTSGLMVWCNQSRSSVSGIPLQTFECYPNAVMPPQDQG